MRLRGATGSYSPQWDRSSLVVSQALRHLEPVSGADHRGRYVEVNIVAASAIEASLYVKGALLREGVAAVAGDVEASEPEWVSPAT